MRKTALDPRLLLYGFTMLSQNNPNLDKQLELFSNTLKTTHESILNIQNELKSFETSIHSLAMPSNTNSYFDQPESVFPVQKPDVIEVEGKVENVKEKLLETISEFKPDELTSFLNELEVLINKQKEND